MGYSSISIPLVITLVICFSVDADDSYEKCFGSPAKYSKESLNDFVNELQTNATVASFWNASRDEGSTNQVYGLASCRGDLDLSDRMKCLAHVANLIAHSDCVNDGQFFLNDYCSIKVSSNNFFGILDFDESNTGTGVYSRKGAFTRNNISDSITTFMKGTADAACTDTSYYHDAQVYNPTENVTIYGMSQCTRDLPVDTDRCKVCLELARSTLDTSKLGGTVVSGSCQVRYETYKFLNN
ncbi:hypothetical protein CASFOL_040897 [Castilleja foliolosa]|uniref:Gnk2-homologous domain-containing protein n=1 Tax=Castilleja foliolosa TaxID=1961234 RepID=A0ABD3BDS3_9LAMI